MFATIKDFTEAPFSHSIHLKPDGRIGFDNFKVLWSKRPGNNVDVWCNSERKIIENKVFWGNFGDLIAKDTNLDVIQ